MKTFLDGRSLLEGQGQRTNSMAVVLLETLPAAFLGPSSGALRPVVEPLTSWESLPHAPLILISEPIPEGLLQRRAAYCGTCLVFVL